MVECSYLFCEMLAPMDSFVAGLFEGMISTLAIIGLITILRGKL